MSYSGHIDSSQTYDGYKAIEVLDPACTECLMKGKECFQNSNPKSSKLYFCFVGKKLFFCPGMPPSNIGKYLWRKTDGPFGKEFPVSEAPTLYGTSGYSNLTGSKQREVARWTNVGGPIAIVGRPIYSSSAVPISRINTEVEVVLNSAGHQFSTPPSQPAAKILKSQVVSSTPRNFQPVLSTIPPPLPSPSTARPALSLTVRPSPITQLRNLPMVTSQQLQPVAGSSRGREDCSPLLFPPIKVFQQRERCPIQVTREDPNMGNEGQYSVTSLFIRVERNSREVIMYANDGTIPGNSPEEMAAKFSW
ncbi:hypothetical protein O181_010849 [Austropuccinia psidii MF-1]|uniref:Uncharacterized protein n=1 Tax=Austropuccinia psidii MF-1 TaxID=1389203 RepID=A0A9Q3BRV8_9BASI|nr:hypothetical protein [Austropuccinia psidii MF-1]